MFEFFVALIMMMYYTGVIMNTSMESVSHRAKTNRHDKEKKEWISVVTDSDLEREVSSFVYNRLKIDEVNDILRNITKDIEGFPDIDLDLTMDAKKIKRIYGMSKKESEECERLERNFAVRTIMAYNGKLTTYDAMTSIGAPWAWYMFSSNGMDRSLCSYYFDWINNRIKEISDVDERMVVRTFRYDYYYFDAVKNSKTWLYEVLWEPQVIDKERIQNCL